MKRLLTIVLAVVVLLSNLALAEEAPPVYLWVRKPIAAGYHTVALTADGAVNRAGYSRNGLSQSDEWQNVVALAAGIEHTVGLLADGTVVAAGYDRSGMCRVADLTDVVAIAAGENNTVCVLADGTVKVLGDNAGGQNHTYAWTDVIAAAAGSAHTLGLRADGTVLAVGDNAQGQCDVSGWTEVIAVAAHGDTSVALKADGTLYMTGMLRPGMADAAAWTGLVDMAVGAQCIFGLTAEGHVLMAGEDTQEMEAALAWTGVICIAAGENHIVGLLADGTVCAAGRNHYGQCDLTAWAQQGSDASAEETELPVFAVLSAMWQELNTDDLATAKLPEKALQHLPVWQRVPGYEMPVAQSQVAKGVVLDFIGIINIPAIDRKLPVQYGWSYDQMVYTPCRYAGSCYGKGFVIIAHRYTKHFSDIGLLPEGASVTFTDMAGNVFRYEVTAIEILNPDQNEELLDDSYDLSLMTCTLSGSQRVVVRCMRKVNSIHMQLTESMNDDEQCITNLQFVQK
ncbi:MAG: sortase [Clostridia bacterium]|nr:sortase [Clostridia bacterium]